MSHPRDVSTAARVYHISELPHLMIVPVAAIARSWQNAAQSSTATASQVGIPSLHSRSCRKHSFPSIHHPRPLDMQPSGAAKTSRNPFRALVSGSNSNNTSASSSSSAGPPNSSAVPPVPVKGAPQQDVHGAERDVQESSSSSDSSRSPSPAQRSAPPSQGGGPSRSDDLREILRAETPPPYTPTPDVYQGETTVEFGPRRPFEAAPAPGQTPWQQRPRWQAPQPTGQFAGYPGAGRRPPVGNHLNVPPPPQHPLQRASTTGRPTSAPNFARSEFARDFYTAGADSGGLMGGSSSQYAPPPSQPPNGASLYAAPPGPPPANGERSVSPAATGTSQADNDGRPTNTPVPGHPLMNNGRVLVYPLGHECKKCTSRIYPLCELCPDSPTRS